MRSAKHHEITFRCKTCGFERRVWEYEPAPTDECRQCLLSHDWLKWTSKHRAAEVIIRKQQEEDGGNELALAYVEVTRQWLAAWHVLPAEPVVTAARLFGPRT